MGNVFMEEFKKRLTKGLILGGVMVVLMLLSPVLMGRNAFASIPWYLVPVVLIVTVLYGTGWYFGFNLIKRAWRKALRVSYDASVWEAINGRGLLLGLVYSMLCFTAGCFISFIVGNCFMVADFLLAKKGKPPVSLKYKFDSDRDYDRWTDSLRAAVVYNDIVHNASAKRRLENEINLQNIENGYVGTIQSDVTEGSETVKRKTTIF